MMALVEQTRSPLLGNRYHLYERLGVGGMGVVYRAHDRLTGETVALKRVANAGLPTADDPALRLALAHEFQALAGLRHPNIIGVRDYGFAGNGQPYFTMDLLYNPRTIVAAGQFLALATKVQLLQPVLHALAYLHRRGLIHRDLKPGNILVSGQTVKVLDFGLAALSGQTTPPSGTLRYMAPEVLQGTQATPVSDLYAVGVIAYELFAGWHPFAPTGQTVSTEQLITLEPDWDYLDLEPALLTVLQRLLAKEPTARYPDATSVIAALSEATSQSLPVETAATRESFLQAAPFIGRDHEFAQLTTALAQAVAGQGSAWLIGGESGVGKSRLLSELRTQALVQGILVVRSQASSAGGALYQLWPEVVRWLLLLTEPSDLEAAVLKPLLPTIAEFLEHPVADAPLLEAKLAQSRLFSTVAALLQRAAAQRPLLLLLEDLHWADENSLALLQWLNRLVQEPEPGQTALLLVATYRRGEAPKLPEQLETMQHILLRRLQPTQVEALSVAMLGDQGRRAQLVQFLQQETEGNTFFVVEVLRALAEEAGQLERVAAMTLPKQIFPGGVQQVVQRRLQRAPAAYQRRLQWAAVAGRQLDLAVLRAVDKTTDLDEWLDVCANAMILELQEGRWQFSHDKLREGLLQTVAADTRRHVHQQLGLTIERVHADQLMPHYANLAYHFGQAGDREKERVYLRLAGDAAQAVYANSAALTAYRQLLAISVDPNGQGFAWQQIGAILRLIGQWTEAEAALCQALDLAAAAADHPTEAHLLQAMGSLLSSRSDQQAALLWLEKARQRWVALANPRELAATLNEMGVAYQQLGEYEQATAHLEEGYRLAQAHHETEQMAIVKHSLGRVAQDQGDYPAMARHLREALTHFRTTDNKFRLAATLNNLGNLARVQGDYVQAETLYTECITIRRAIGDKHGLASALNNLGILTQNRQDYQQATQLYQESLQLRQELGDRQGMATALANIGALAYIDGNYAETERLFGESLAIYRALGNKLGIALILYNLGEVTLAQTNYQQARRYYQESLHLLAAIGDKQNIALVLIGLAAIAFYAAQDNERAICLAGAAQQLLTTNALVLDPITQASFDRVRQGAQARLSAEQFKQAWQAGQHFTLEAAVRYAIEAKDR